MPLQKLGRIRSVLYSCDSVRATSGLCQLTPATPRVHEFERNAPILAKDDKGNFHILCSVEYYKGGLATLGQRGIDDAEVRANCRIVPLPNPAKADLEIVGVLELIELEKGAGWEFQNRGSILAYHRKTKTLHILNRRDVPSAMPVAQNPERIFSDFEGPSLKEIAGRAYWTSLHSYAAMYVPGDKTTAKAVVEGGLDAFPCPECRAYGLQYVKDHPPDYSSRMALANWAYAFHDTINRHLGKESPSWDEVKAAIVPEGSCADGACRLPEPNPMPRPELALLITKPGCSHCLRTKLALVDAGVRYREVPHATEEGKKLLSAYGVNVVPFLVLPSGKTRLGELTLAEARKLQ